MSAFDEVNAASAAEMAKRDGYSTIRPCAVARRHGEYVIRRQGGMWQIRAGEIILGGDSDLVPLIDRGILCEIPVSADDPTASRMFCVAA